VLIVYPEMTEIVLLFHYDLKTNVNMASKVRYKYVDIYMTLFVIRKNVNIVSN